MKIMTIQLNKMIEYHNGCFNSEIKKNKVIFRKLIYQSSNQSIRNCTDINYLFFFNYVFLSTSLIFIYIICLKLR
jgi:hypothetical protein